MLMMVWFLKVGFGRLTSWVMMLLMRLLILDVGELVLLSLMLAGIFLEFVVVGTLSFLTFIVSSLPFLVLWLTMMVLVVLLLILLSGLLVLSVRGVGWFMRFGTAPFCLGLLVFGSRIGCRFLLLLSVLRMLIFGPILLGFWLSGFLS